MTDLPAPPAPSTATGTTASELRLVLGQLVRRLRAAGARGETQGSVISRLDRLGATTISELARVEGVRSQSMGATISALEAEGFVQRRPDPVDGRQMLVSLTARGRDALAGDRAAREAWLEREITARLSDDERRTLDAAIGILRRLLDEPA